MGSEANVGFTVFDRWFTFSPAKNSLESGIPVTPGPNIILCPAFAITQEEIMNKVQGGKITTRSSLVLEGEGLTIKNLDLDGALVIRTGPGCEVEVDGLVVKNKGWEKVELKEG